MQITNTMQRLVTSSPDVQRMTVMFINELCLSRTIPQEIIDRFQDELSSLDDKEKNTAIAQ